MSWQSIKRHKLIIIKKILNRLRQKPKTSPLNFWWAIGIGIPHWPRYVSKLKIILISCNLKSTLVFLYLWKWRKFNKKYSSFTQQPTMSLKYLHSYFLLQQCIHKMHFPVTAVAQMMKCMQITCLERSYFPFVSFVN